MSALERATSRVVAAVSELSFGPPVDLVYNPLVHAGAAHREWLQRYGPGQKDIVLIGMNPGPFGMVQTGVPFGEVAAVRDWLGIEEPVEPPARQHPKRPIEGFASARSEVSGRRLWGWVRERFGTPQRFFARFWIHNYCPLAFLEAGGRNLTPDKLPKADSHALFAACDRYLREVVAAVGATQAIGVGAFAEDRARRTLAATDLRFGRIPHPSPASPAANRGWAAAADAAFAALGIVTGD